VRYDNGYPNVFRDIEQNIFRLYYTTFSYDKDSAQTRLEERPFRQYMPSKSRATCTCYAMSTDGVHWQKPELGLSEFEGNLANSIILKNAHGTSVLYDRADPDPTKRYKLITKCIILKKTTIWQLLFLGMVSTSAILSDGQNTIRQQIHITLYLWIQRQIGMCSSRAFGKMALGSLPNPRAAIS